MAKWPVVVLDFGRDWRASTSLTTVDHTSMFTLEFADRSDSASVIGVCVGRVSQTADGWVWIKVLIYASAQEGRRPRATVFTAKGRPSADGDGYWFKLVGNPRRIDRMMIWSVQHPVLERMLLAGAALAAVGLTWHIRSARK